MNEANNVNHTQPLAVIIGAGQNGRGFIARLVNKSKFNLKFIDINNELIKKINEDNAYTVHYFDKEITSVRIKNVSACHLESEEAVNALSLASIIFTSIGENNLPTIVDPLKKAAKKRLSNNNKKPLRIITCENGEASEEILRRSLTEDVHQTSQFEVSESIILCSTVTLSETRLDLISEYAHYLPYNKEANIGDLEIPGIVATENFRNFLKQKLYTYNTLSACIAYLGALKQYEIYSEAANDSEIQHVINRILPSLNYAICTILEIDAKTQNKYSNNALIKFMDKNIVDNIAKNARDVIRKLGPNDRLVQPALMVMETGGDPSDLALVIAAALHYDDPQDTSFRNEVIKLGPFKSFSKISELSESHKLVRLVGDYYDKLTNYKESNRLDKVSN